MLDDNLDPTPLLKEIRDDKVATIIIDANASVSYLILKKVRTEASRPQNHPHVFGSEVRADSLICGDLFLVMCRAENVKFQLSHL